ncbi:MAG: hypothetical protein Q4E17_00135 [Synergistes sp.]|nr:hypothetical protein [Synergistes sp.]
MLYLWRKTDIGKIWLDGEGVKNIIRKRMPKEFLVQSVSLSGEDDVLNIYIAVSEETDADVKKSLETRFCDIFGKAGLTVRTNWINVAPEDNETRTALWKKPVFWSVAAGALCGLYFMGISGIVWSVFCAAVVFIIMWLILTEDGRKQIAKLIRQARS